MLSEQNCPFIAALLTHNVVKRPL